MDKENNKNYEGCLTLDDLIDAEYGTKGTPERELFDAETQEFCIAQTLREERLRAGLTQQQLADRVGTKKTYISKIENGKADIQLTTLFRLFGGLGKRISVAVL